MNGMQESKKYAQVVKDSIRRIHPEFSTPILFAELQMALVRMADLHITLLTAVEAMQDDYDALLEKITEVHYGNDIS